MNTPEFFYFDLGNVLLSFDHRIACANISKLAGVSVDKVWKVIFEGSLQADYETGSMTDEAFHAAFCEATNSRSPLQDFKAAASDMFEKQAEVVAIAESLREQTDQVGILSNTCKAHWEFVGARFPDVLAPFEVFALSYELFSMKPAPEIYTKAATLAGHEPGNIFFVDDRPENVQAAITAGYDAVRFTSACELQADLKERGINL